MKGFTTRTTPTGYFVAQIHYTADPAKDPATPEGLEWLKREVRGYKGGLSSSAWRKEMEIDWKARSGHKVFEGLELMRDKIMINPFKIESWHEVNGGYDWGKRNPFAYIEMAVIKECKYAMFGASGSGVDVPAQAEMIKRSPYASRVKHRYADPSIWTEDQVSKNGTYTSFQRVFDELGINFIKGRTDDIALMERLEAEWFEIKVDDHGKVVKVPKENPTFKIFKNLEFLWESLINLRWSEFSPTAEQQKGKKEEIAHSGNDPWDALKYVYLSLPCETPEPPKRMKEWTEDYFEYREEKEDEDVA